MADDHIYDVEGAMRAFDHISSGELSRIAAGIADLVSLGAGGFVELEGDHAGQNALHMLVRGAARSAKPIPKRKLTQWATMLIEHGADPQQSAYEVGEPWALAREHELEFLEKHATGPPPPKRFAHIPKAARFYPPDNEWMLEEDGPGHRRVVTYWSASQGHVVCITEYDRTFTTTRFHADGSVASTETSNHIWDDMTRRWIYRPADVPETHVYYFTEEAWGPAQD